MSSGPSISNKTPSNLDPTDREPSSFVSQNPSTQNNGNDQLSATIHFISQEELALRDKERLEAQIHRLSTEIFDDPTREKEAKIVSHFLNSQRRFLEEEIPVLYYPIKHNTYDEKANAKAKETASLPKKINVGEKKKEYSQGDKEISSYPIRAFQLEAHTNGPLETDLSNTDTDSALSDEEPLRQERLTLDQVIGRETIENEKSFHEGNDVAFIRVDLVGKNALKEAMQDGKGKRYTSLEEGEADPYKHPNTTKTKSKSNRERGMYTTNSGRSWVKPIYEHLKDPKNPLKGNKPLPRDSQIDTKMRLPYTEVLSVSDEERNISMHPLTYRVKNHPYFQGNQNEASKKDPGKSVFSYISQHGFSWNHYRPDDESFLLDGTDLYSEDKELEYSKSALTKSTPIFPTNTLQNESEIDSDSYIGAFKNLPNDDIVSKPMKRSPKQSESPNVKKSGFLSRSYKALLERPTRSLTGATFGSISTVANRTLRWTFGVETLEKEVFKDRLETLVSIVNLQKREKVIESTLVVKNDRIKNAEKKVRELKKELSLKERDKWSFELSQLENNSSELASLFAQTQLRIDEITPIIETLEAYQNEIHTMIERENFPLSSENNIPDEYIKEFVSRYEDVVKAFLSTFEMIIHPEELERILKEFSTNSNKIEELLHEIQFALQQYNAHQEPPSDEELSIWISNLTSQERDQILETSENPLESKVGNEIFIPAYIEENSGFYLQGHSKKFESDTDFLKGVLNEFQNYTMNMKRSHINEKEDLLNALREMESEKERLQAQIDLIGEDIKKFDNSASFREFKKLTEEIKCDKKQIADMKKEYTSGFNKREKLNKKALDNHYKERYNVFSNVVPDNISTFREGDDGSEAIDDKETNISSKSSSNKGKGIRKEIELENDSVSSFPKAESVIRGENSVDQMDEKQEKEGE